MSNVASIYSGEKYNKRTILEGGVGQIAGWQGEAAFALELMKHKLPFTHTGCLNHPYDFVVYSRGRKITIDVKCKKRNVQPASTYEGHINTYQQRFNVMAYVFANVTQGEVTFMGWMYKKRFWEKARIVEKGQMTDGGFTEYDQSAKMRYVEMVPMDALWERLCDG